MGFGDIDIEEINDYAAITTFSAYISTKVMAAAPRVVVDGLIVSFEYKPAPFIEKGNTLVPLAPIFEVLGTDVITAPNSDKIVVVMGDSMIEMQVGSDNAYINGVLHKLPVPIKKVDGYPMVRFGSSMKPCLPRLSGCRNSIQFWSDQRK